MTMIATAQLWLATIAAHWQPLTTVMLLVPLAFALLGAIGLGRRELVSPLARRNSAVSLLFFAASMALLPLTIVAAGGMAAAYQGLGLPRLSPGFWAGLPFWVSVLAALVGLDFADYAVHRWLHTRLGWPIHAIHHSDSQVNGFTTFRVHWLELLAMQLSRILLLSWLGLPVLAVAATTGLRLAHNIYVHLELDIEHGPLRHVIASPRFHRWHHLDDARAYETNLANMFPVFDLIFGSYRVPQRLPAAIGAASAGVPDTDFVRLMLFPFAEWGRMAQRAVARRHTA